MKDYYEVLGVERDASSDDLKKAYRKQAMRFHPDRNPGDKEAETRFKEAAEAYEVLSDSDKRKNYDRFGHAGLRNGASGGPAGFQDVRDIFSVFSDIFGGGSGFSDIRMQRSRSRGRKGEGLRMHLSLTLKEIAEGTKKQVKVQKKVQCGDCHGSGAKEGEEGFVTCHHCDGRGEVRRARRTMMGDIVSVQACDACEGHGRIIKHKCDSCNGEGRVSGEETIPIDVPAGVTEGNYFTFKGRGNAGTKGGPAGDLNIEIRELPDDNFVREGLDIYYDCYISFPAAALGTEVEVPTLKGRARIQIDPGTQSGKKLRMSRRGLPDYQGRRRGDQFVRIHVWTPHDLSDEERQMLESVRDSPSFQPSKDRIKNSKSFFGRVKDVFS